MVQVTRCASARKIITFCLIFSTALVFTENIDGASIAQSVDRDQFEVRVQQEAVDLRGLWVQLEKQVLDGPAIFIPKKYQHLVAELLGCEKEDLKKFVVGATEQNSVRVQKKGELTVQKQKALWLLSTLKAGYVAAATSVQPSQEWLLDAYETLYTATCRIWLRKGAFVHESFANILKEELVGRYTEAFFREGKFDAEALWKRLATQPGWDKFWIAPEDAEEGEMWSLRLYLFECVSLEVMYRSSEKEVVAATRATLNLWEKTEVKKRSDELRQLLSPNSKTPASERRFDRQTKIKESRKIASEVLKMVIGQAISKAESCSYEPTAEPKIASVSSEQMRMQQAFQENLENADREQAQQALQADRKNAEAQEVVSEVLNMVIGQAISKAESRSYESTAEPKIARFC